MQRLQNHLDLLSVSALALCLSLLIGLFPDAIPPLRIALGFIFMLLAPGYALTAALFPRRTDVDAVERLLLTLGLSVITVPLLGFLLNYTPWGIRLLPMTVGLNAFTLVASLLALRRRAHLPLEARFFSRATLPGFMRTLGLLVATSLLISLITFFAQTLRPSEVATEFYMLGPQRRLEGFPRTLQPGELFTVFVGVRNHEGRRASFRVEIPFMPGAPELRIPQLADGEVWEARVELLAPEEPGRTALTLELYREGDTTPYRTLQIFVTLGKAVTPPRVRAA